MRPKVAMVLVHEYLFSDFGSLVVIPSSCYHNVFFYPNLIEIMFYVHMNYNTYSTSQRVPNVSMS